MYYLYDIYLYKLMHEAGHSSAKGLVMFSDDEVEQEVQAKGLTAPRVTPDEVDQTITTRQFHVFPGTTVTVCALTLRNGFVITGESACASPENFDKELGRKIAFGNARDKIWQLEGYALRDRLATG